MRSRWPTIALLLALLAAPAAVAADSAVDGNDPGARSSDDGERAAAQEKRADDPEKGARERIGDDLTSCKRDADGMRGPERSRFMTKCLRERK